MFSNFSSFKVEYDGVLWMTSEHAYQAAKFKDPSTREKIMNALSSHDAFELSRVYSKEVRNDWGDIKIPVMKDIVRNKLYTHQLIQEKLLETGTRVIVEDSPTDSFWGWGPDKKGRNELGKIWMELRGDLQKSFNH